MLIPQAFLAIIQDCFHYTEVFLCFHMKIKVVLPIPFEKMYWDFDGDVIESIDLLLLGCPVLL